MHIRDQLLRSTLVILLALAGASEGGQYEDLSAWSVTDHSMTISGTSTMHDWESQVTKVAATGKIKLRAGELQSVSELAVEIPVAGILSPHDLMDRLTHRALKEPDHPQIHYKLTSLKRVDGDNWVSTGELTIAGTVQPLEMDVQITTDDDGSLSVTGTTAFKMTHFGVTPPRLMFGAVKVGDAIQINFSVTLQSTTNQPDYSEISMH